MDWWGWLLLGWAPLAMIVGWGIARAIRIAERRESRRRNPPPD